MASFYDRGLFVSYKNLRFRWISITEEKKEIMVIYLKTSLVELHTSLILVGKQSEEQGKSYSEVFLVEKMLMSDSQAHE